MTNHKLESYIILRITQNNQMFLRVFISFWNMIFGDAIDLDISVLYTSIWLRKGSDAPK